MSERHAVAMIQHATDKKLGRFNARTRVPKLHVGDAAILELLSRPDEEVVAIVNKWTNPKRPYSPRNRDRKSA